VAYAAFVLGAPPGSELPADARHQFEEYLAQWSRPPEPGGPHRWTYEISCDEAKYLLHTLHRVVVAAEASIIRNELPAFPRQAVSFYRCLVRALLDAVASDSPACAAWAEDLGRFWPGFEPSPQLLSAQGE
jgi:hypothetical protein